MMTNFDDTATQKESQINQSKRPQTVTTMGRLEQTGVAIETKKPRDL